MPPLAIRYDGRWVNAPLRGDLDEWASKATADYITAHGGDKRQVRALLEGGCQIARRAEDAVMALLLMPVAAEGVRAIVRFCPVDMSVLADDVDGWSALIGDLTPNSPWDEAAEVTELTTKAGPCRRVIRKTVESEESGESEGGLRAVNEHIAYAWLFPQHSAGIVMLTSFINLAEAGMWRGALDELAASVELERAA
jgi:hypothetical protein